MVAEEPAALETERAEQAPETGTWVQLVGEKGIGHASDSDHNADRATAEHRFEARP